MWRRVTLGIAAVVLVVLSVAITIFFHEGTDRGDNAVAIKPGPPGKTVDLASRESDSTPLRVKEVFPTKALQFGKVRYEVLASEEVKECPETVSGEAAAQLRRSNCNQLVRAALSDPDRGLLMTVGIVNLSTSQEVDALATALRGNGGGNFDMIVPTDMTVTADQPRPLHFSRNGHYLVFATGVPIKAKPGDDLFNNPALAQALNITRTLTAQALERRQLGASVA